MQLSIIIPAYNEEARIAKTLQEIDVFLKNTYRDTEYEVLVIDDGSTDGTRELVTSLTKTILGLRLIVSPKNGGKGAAVKRGMLEARGDYRLFMDADHSTHISHLPLLLTATKKGSDVVIGSRRAPGANVAVKQGVIRDTLGKGFRFLVRSITSLPIHDTQNGFKLFTRKAAEAVFPELTTYGWAFDVETLTRAQNKNLKITEVPIVWKNDTASKVTPYGMVKMLFELIRIQFKTSTTPWYSVSPFIILCALTFATHFLLYGYPNQVVFDEVHFGKFVSGYLSGHYFFDIHPPLGKLLVTLVGRVFGYNEVFSFEHIGLAYPDSLYLALRFLPTLAGMLLPLALYSLSRRFGLSKKAALLVGVLTAVEGSLLVQSRFILLDSLLLLFGVLGVTAFTYAFKKERFCSVALIASGILIGASYSIKWIGLGFFGALGLFVLFHVKTKRELFKNMGRLALLLGISLIMYIGSFAVHFALLTQSGDGDAFMSAAFQKTLVGSKYAADQSITTTPGFVSKFIELNKEMYESNKRLSATHQYGSTWETWPIMYRPIYYWHGENGISEAKIYLFGNIAIYWMVIVAIILSALSLKKKEFRKTRLTLLGSYVGNLLAFIFIGRVMFLYHYEIALLFGLLLLGLWYDEFNEKYKPVLFTSIITLALLSFVFFFPLIYGISLPKHIFHFFVWFSSWQ